MIFTVRRMQELGRKAQPLFLCFIDLHKAYDSIDRTVLWKVLAPFGVPSQMAEVIRPFHDGMRACMRNDEGLCSKRFDVGQGPRQGCALFPLLFNAFFAAILFVALERSVEDTDILADLARLQEQSSKADPETTLECAPRAI